MLKCLEPIQNTCLRAITGVEWDFLAQTLWRKRSGVRLFGDFFFVFLFFFVRTTLSFVYFILITVIQ